MDNDDPESVVDMQEYDLGNDQAHLEPPGIKRRWSFVEPPDDGNASEPEINTDDESFGRRKDDLDDDDEAQPKPPSRKRRRLLAEFVEDEFSEGGTR